MSKNKIVVRIIVLILVIAMALAALLTTLNATITALAIPPDYYTIYNENNEAICERGEEVEVGDSYITHDNKRYKIVEINEDTKTCKAQFIEEVKLPDVRGELGQVNSLVELEKRAGLYISHNDESYIPSDGTESIYGAGGIHDVARAFAQALRNEGFLVDLDETLHLPHDNQAYVRSRATASKIEREFAPDVLFDIHRDGAPRSLYDTEVGGVPMSAVRIVVGQNNPNFDENYQFALEVKALADEWYPGLVKDIYLGARAYNQDLNPQALLLEFGSEQMEKELVLRSVVPFANVINGVLQRRSLQGAYFKRTPATVMVSTQNGAVEFSTIFLAQILFGGLFLMFVVLVLTNNKWRRVLVKEMKLIKQGILFQNKK